MVFLRVFTLGALGIAQLSAAEKGTANFYQSAPQEYLGKEIRLRVASLTPVPEYTALDQGFVWMEASTGRPKKEEGKIMLRIPSGDSAKLAKTMNLPSASGHWLRGIFAGHDSGAVLPSKIKERTPYYLQISSAVEQKEVPEEMETASGSLVLTPKSKETALAQKPTATIAPTLSASAPAKKIADGPQVVLLRGKPGEPLQLRTAKSVKMEADFCEIMDADGKLSLVGKALVAAILPLPKDGVVPSREEAEAALRLYAEKSQTIPEATALLIPSKASWEKFSAAPVATTASTALPEVEDVETAAGVEEAEVTSGYPSWFGWSTITGSLMLIFLVWLWSRPRSYLT